MLGIVSTGTTEVSAFDIRKLLARDSQPVDWTFSQPWGVGGLISATPVIANGHLYFGTDDVPDIDGAFIALSAHSGELVWSYRGAGEQNIGGVPYSGIGSSQGTPAVSNGKVVFVSYDDNDREEGGIFVFESL